MKKVSMFLLAAGFIGLVSCGPSAEEKAKMEADAKAAADSITNAANAAMEQSTTEAAATDSAAAPAATESAPATEEKK